MNKNLKKILSLVGILLLLFGILYFTGIAKDFSIENLQNIVKKAGIWGVLVYLLLFSICLLLYFPGLLFIFIAIILWGPIWGLLVAYLGSVVATGSNFWIVRKFGGQPVGEIKNKRFLKVAKGIDQHPINTTVIIRIFFWLAPYITYFLAFSSIDSKKYQLGNAIGMIPVVLFFGLGFYFFKDWMMSVFG